MAADKDAVRKPYERPTLIKTLDLKKTVADFGSPPVMGA